MYEQVGKTLRWTKDEHWKREMYNKKQWITYRITRGACKFNSYVYSILSRNNFRNDIPRVLNGVFEDSLTHKFNKSDLITFKL